MNSSPCCFSQWARKIMSFLGCHRSFIIFEDEAAVEQKAAEEGKVLIMYKENVYDITKFLDEHPGGKDILLLANAKIVDKLFDKYHYPLGEAPKMMEKYLIGKIHRNHKIQNTELSYLDFSKDNQSDLKYEKIALKGEE